MLSILTVPTVIDMDSIKRVFYSLSTNDTTVYRYDTNTPAPSASATPKGQYDSAVAGSTLSYDETANHGCDMEDLVDCPLALGTMWLLKSLAATCPVYRIKVTAAADAVPYVRR